MRPFSNSFFSFFSSSWIQILPSCWTHSIDGNEENQPRSAVKRKRNSSWKWRWSNVFYYLQRQYRRQSSESHRTEDGHLQPTTEDATRVHRSSSIRWVCRSLSDQWLPHAWCSNSRHRNLVIKKRGKVIGGITYRPFKKQNFVEIVFCAVSGSEQVKVCPLSGDHSRSLGVRNKNDESPQELCEEWYAVSIDLRRWERQRILQEAGMFHLWLLIS